MMTSIATGGLLLETLTDNPNIKAAVLIDKQGYILEIRGDANCIRSGASDEVVASVPNNGFENVYVVTMGHDLLLVVFDERYNFERLKKSVDSTVSQFQS